MKPLLGLLALLCLLVPATVFASTGKKVNAARARELKEFISKERPQFELRESQRRDALEELDRLNADQNRVRRRINDIQASHQELTMALDNLSLQVERQRSLELVQRKRLAALLKVVYRIKKDGTLRFVVHGENLAAVAGRVRILYRTLRSHTTLTREMNERSNRLVESESKLARTRSEVTRLLEELHEQEMLLSGYLDKKRKLLTAINRKQNSFQVALKEYRQIASQVATLFDNFEALRDLGIPGLAPGRGSLPLPVDTGIVVRNFGKSVHRQFHTVTYHKGIEIEAAHNSPVKAVLQGVVEYEGWLKGLGNVLILHHGGGFYTLSAHLFKSLLKRGDRVAQGDTVGFVGDTGSNEKSSLYFEVRENGKAVDPLTYFSTKALSALN